jgi:hypothetical protein
MQRDEPASGVPGSDVRGPCAWREHGRAGRFVTTAKSHVSRAMIKLAARDRAQLVVFAYQAGLVSPRPNE